jgi:DNA modification methylase
MIRLLQGDVREQLAVLVPGSVHCVVTSPPYWGLRDYGTGTWEGGEAGCDHKRAKQAPREFECGRKDGTGMRSCLSWTERDGTTFGGICGKCGARRIDRQIGLEATPDEFLAVMVEVFRGVRRVLRDDGTCFVNLGDGHTNKQLQMMPARLAIALQADGWWLRSQMPWVKRSAMPESVTDRPASAVEYVFLLTKSARYFFDAEAVKRAPSGNAHAQGNGYGQKADVPGNGTRANSSAKAAMHNATASDLPSSRNFRNSDLFYDSLTAPHGLISDQDGHPLALDVNPSGYANAHFATFSTKLVEPLIRAGCPPGGTVLDPFCGAATTCLVADRLGRDAIGIDLNPVYLEMSLDRLVSDGPLFAQVGVRGDVSLPSRHGVRADAMPLFEGTGS